MNESFFFVLVFAVPVVCKEIYVSRYHGNTLLSCGETFKTACKTIALATAQSRWNDTIYIDGTETSRDPYPCLPMTSHLGGICVNKSLSLRRFGKAEVFLKCSSSRQIVFDGSNTPKTVTIHLNGLTFIDSFIAAQRCSLNVESCNFMNATSFSNATAVVGFETFDGNYSLKIAKSVFSNNSFPCIRVVGNKPEIEVYDTLFTNNTATWESTVKMVDAAVFMVLLTRDEIKYPSYMTLSNVSFIRNTAPFGGCLHIQNVFNSASRQRMKRFKRNRGTKDVRIISQAYSKDQDTRQSVWGHITVFVVEGGFLHNFGGAITVSRDISLVNISIVKSNFINNSSPLNGGAMLVESSGEFRLHIEDTKFVENSAKNEGSAIYIIAVTLTKGSLLVKNVLFLRNILQQPNFIEDVPLGGTLTVYVQQGYLEIILVNVSFIYNEVAMGSSTLHCDGIYQDIAIVDCRFHGNSQDERFSYGWKTIHIVSIHLNFTLSKTIVSGNSGKPMADNNTLVGQPVHFFVAASYVAHMNISGLQYKNNNGGGMYIQLGLSETRSPTFLLQDSNFENNEFFSLEIKAKSNVYLVMKRVWFTANTFISSIVRSLALVLLYFKGQDNEVKMENATFENNTVQGRIVLFRLPEDEKDPYACKIPRWKYKNYIQLLEVEFSRNFPDTSVLRLENGYNNLSNCRFVDNLAPYTVFISESSTSLELVNTSFEQTKNGATIHPSYSKLMIYSFTGFIYWASLGPIQLKNTSLTVESPQDIEAYFMVTGASAANIDTSSVIQCPVGTLKTQLNLAHSRFVSNEVCPNSLYNTMSKSFILSCKSCSPGFYSVEPFAKKCRPCPFGGNCTSNIAAKPTFWGFPLLSDHGIVSFQNCPMGYCCPYRNISCPYDNQQYLSSGCSGNRTGFLCGECKPGFTETLFSSRCQAKDDCTDYWFWPVVLFYSLAFAFLLLWKYPIVRFIKRLLPWKRGTQGGHFGAASPSNGGGYIKVVFYFYQVANLVFVSEGLEIHLADNYLLTPIIGWFDFKAISSNKALVCPFRGLTVASKIFLEASQVFAVLSGVLVIFLFHGAVRTLNKQSPANPPSGQYVSATTECLLLGYSALASAALKALNCVEIQSTLRFFYDGNVQCWCWWQKLCGFFLAVFIIPFVFVLYLGSHLLNSKFISPRQFICGCIFPLPFAVLWMVKYKKIPRNDSGLEGVSSERAPLLSTSVEQSTSSSGSLDQSQATSCNLMEDVVYGPFRKSSDEKGAETVYWESILIGRRLVLICLHTFIVFPFIRIVCLSVTCAAFLVHHIWKKPFQDSRVNHAETASLTALLVLAIINLAEVTLGINGELLSEQERICMTVLHIVEMIILGTLPLTLVVVIVVSALWRLFEFFLLSFAACCKLVVS